MSQDQKPYNWAAGRPNLRQGAIVVGAGIGGLTVALCLARSGITPIVCERTPEIRNIGSGITIRTNATRVLKDLGVLEHLQKQTSTISSAAFHDEHGKLLRRWQLPITGTDTITVRRTDLQRALLERLARYPHRLELGFSLERFIQTPEKVTAFFANGKSLEAGALIGCDGINSYVRRQLVDGVPPVFRGYVQWRFISDRRHPVVCPHEKLDWWGSGLRFGASPLGTGMAWYVSTNTPDPNFRGDEPIKDYFVDLFRGWANPIREMIAEVIPEDVVWTSVFDRPCTPRWSDGRVTLLGDAAHPFTPELGLGGTLAIEDADELHRCLLCEQDIISALRTYEMRRLPKAVSVSAKSRFTGDMAQWSNPVMVAARRVLFIGCPDFIWNRKLKRTYG
jgi:2-polyprenyl-6-methoxyphenol hydroxylase-like FAD-dependent oxidoreductase